MNLNVGSKPKVNRSDVSRAHTQANDSNTSKSVFYKLLPKPPPPPLIRLLSLVLLHIS